MRILRPSSRFYGAMLALASSVPLVAFELFLMRKGIGVPRPIQLSIWCSFALLAALLLASLSWRVQKSAIAPLFLIGTTWFFQAMFSAARLKNISLAWFAFAVIGVIGAAVVLMIVEFSSPEYDPGMRWYEGAPRPIPGLSCEIVEGSAMKVSRLGEHGAFVFQDGGTPPFGSSDKNTLSAEETELVLRFRGKSLACRAQAVSALRSGQGAGFVFKGLSADARKELGDFVEVLRGEGYV